MGRNTGDAEQVRQSNESEKLRRENEVADLKALLNTPFGRRVLWRILEWSGCEGTPMRSTNELTYMAIGSGDVGRWLKSEIVFAGEDFLFTIMKERQGEVNARRNKASNSSDGNTED